MKRNILQFIHSFIQGGSERQMIQLTRLLQKSGRYNVYAACLNDWGVLRNELSGLGHIPEFPLRNFYDGNAIRQLYRFARFLREHDIAIVHTHEFYGNIFGMAAAKLAGVPVRIASRRETGGMRTGAQKRVERGAYALSHAIVANAEAVRGHLIEEGVSSEKITVIYNGLDIERMRPRADLPREEALALFNLPREGARRFVTILANMRHSVKDHPTFLRAAHRVREQFPDAAFVLAGEGELMNDLRELAASLGLNNDALFVGRCEQTAELLALSDVCVLSSKAEGFSNSILEYMAAARPVVATDVGGASEAIVENETGYLVEAGDDEALAARIISLLRNPQLAQAMGERGRSIVEKKFSCAAQLARTEQLYDHLLTTKQATRLRSLQSVSRESASK